MDDKLTLTPLARLQVPIGGQTIELLQADWAHGGLSLLRLRIREGKRFTIFDVDAGTAQALGNALLDWSAARAGGAPAAAANDSPLESPAPATPEPPPA